MSDKTVALTSDLAVLGAGPGGYVAAIRAAQLGRDVVLIDEAELGGVCLNWGCIPTKALLRSAEVLSLVRGAGEFGIETSGIDFDFARVVGRSREVAGRLSQGVGHLMKKNGIRVLSGRGRLAGPGLVAVTSADGARTHVEAAQVIIATGARTRDFPGLRMDGKRVISSREAMTLEQVPRSMVIVGAGSIGVEFGHLFQTFGTEVTLLEMMPAILPASDKDVSRELARAFKKRKVKLHTEARLVELVPRDDGVSVTFERRGKRQTMETEYVLMAVGVVPNSEDLGLEEQGIDLDNGWIKVDSFCRTSQPTVYAIGDVTGPPCLAHVASAQGVLAVEHMAGRQVTPIRYDQVPACTYCQPQVASVGLTEEGALEAGLEIVCGRFPWRANGKALALGEIAGFVKTVVEKPTGKLLGLHVVGSEATELLQEYGLGLTLEATAADILATIHPHPTLSEALQEATAAALGEALHL